MGKEKRKHNGRSPRVMIIVQLSSQSIKWQAEDEISYKICESKWGVGGGWGGVGRGGGRGALFRYWIGIFSNQPLTMYTNMASWENQEVKTTGVVVLEWNLINKDKKSRLYKELVRCTKLPVINECVWIDVFWEAIVIVLLQMRLVRLKV